MDNTLRMSEKRDKKSKREGTLSNVLIRIDDGSSEVETKPLKVSAPVISLLIVQPSILKGS